VRQTKEEGMRQITYYAIAKNSDGKIEQLLVKRGREKSQEWTGKIYKSLKEAEQDLINLNVSREGNEKAQSL